MDTESLKSFIDISKTQNFTKTAKNFFITQAAVSHRIREIEEALGCSLFVRTNKGVHLSPEGEIFLPYVENALSEIDAGTKKIQEYLNQKKKNILISTITPAVNVFLAPAIGEFGVLHPEISIELQRINPAQLHESILRNVKHIYISNIGDLINDGQWNIQILATDPFVLIMKEGMECNSIEEAKEIVRTHKIYLIPQRYSPSLAIKSRRLLEKLGAEPLQQEELYPVESIMFSIASGTGVAVLPRNIYTAMRSFGLKQAPLGVDEHIDLSIAWHKNAEDYIHNFVSLILENLSK